MNSQQYEELCRYFLSDKLGVSTDQIESVHIPNPKRPDLPEYKHQIDLYWEIKTELSLYLHIANAKWRSSAKVDQPDVLLLQKVKEKVAAHKAFMLTNQGYTSGAVAVAKDEGIALHIVKPNFNLANLPNNDRVGIQNTLLDISSNSNKPVYMHEIVYRAFDFSETKHLSERPEFHKLNRGHQTRVLTGYTNRVDRGYSNRAINPSRGNNGVVTRGGGSFTKGRGITKR
jgi:hypothetical protein